MQEIGKGPSQDSRLRFDLLPIVDLRIDKVIKSSNNII